MHLIDNTSLPAKKMMMMLMMIALMMIIIIIIRMTTINNLYSDIHLFAHLCGFANTSL